MVSTHHIIFENIGQMATAVTYIHAKFTINFTAIEDHFAIYITTIRNFRAQLGQKHEFPYEYLKAMGYSTPKDPRQAGIEKTLNLFRNITEENLHQIFYWRQDSATQLMVKVAALKNAMPKPSVRSDHIILKKDLTGSEIFKNATSKIKEALMENVMDQVLKAGRTTRFIPGIALGLGALGTFMGLYNRKQIKELKRGLSEVSDGQNQLIEVIQDHYHYIKELETNEQLILHHIAQGTLTDPTLITHKLLTMEMELQQRVELAVHGVQMAQLRRLAVDLIPASQLNSLYERIVFQAQHMKHKLLTEVPSDLFQLEISYFYDGENIHLLLHVPSIPENSMLRLLKLHPFPLPINSNFSVIPSVRNDILAISAGGQTRYSSQISSVDLLGCHSVNNVYLCEKSGVLNKDLNGTCMGALYIQDFSAAQELCDLEIQPSKEIVRPLLRNQFLIFSPEPQTSFITCQNESQSEKYVPMGISKMEISAGCRANLQHHILVTDNAIRLDTDIVHYEWNFDSRTTVDYGDEISEQMAELLASGITSPTMNDLQHLRLKKSKMNYLWYFISFILSILAISLIVLLILIIWCRYPLSKLPCFGPLMTAFSLVSKARVETRKYKGAAQTIAKRVRQPRANPRNRPPEAETYEEVELATQQVH